MFNQYKLKTAQKNVQNAVGCVQMLYTRGIEIACETVTSTGSDLKTIPKRCEMKMEPLAVSCEHKIRYFFAPL